MQLSALRVYPLKSGRGIEVPAAVVQPWGLEHDRRWMVVDGSGQTVTARDNHRLLLVTATPRPGGITLSADGDSLLVDAPSDGEVVDVGMSRVGQAVAGFDADHWLSSHLGEPVRLVWLDDPQRRTISPEHGAQPGETLSLADAGPLLLTTTASLTQLNTWVADTARVRREPSPDTLVMTRFRPNVVVDGSETPFAEDEWKRVRIGEVEFRFGEHCDRCVLPTIDPETLAGGKEPTRTLARHRQWDHRVFFGIRLIPRATGTIRVGDEVVPL